MRTAALVAAWVAWAVAWTSKKYVVPKPFESPASAGLFLVRPARARSLEVQVLYVRSRMPRK